MHARQQPYAGPVVITGYVYPQPGEEEGGWPEDLSPPAVRAVREIHAAVQAVLAGDEPVAAPWATPAWAADIAGLAQEVRTGPTPGLTLR